MPIGHADADATERSGIEHSARRSGRRDAKARKSPPSVMTMPSRRSLSCSAASSLFGCMRPSVPSGARAIDLRNFAARSSCRVRSPAAQSPIDRWTSDCPPRRPSRVSAAAGRRTDLDRAAPVVAHLRGRIGDAHEPRGTEHGGRAEGELEVEPAADGQHDVGLAHARRRASRRPPKDA